MGVIGSKEARNAGWLIGGRVARILLTFVVGILTARYLGPDNFGLIGYASTFAVFLAPLCGLGLSSILVKVFIDEPDSQGGTLGTSLGLRFLSSALVYFFIVGLAALIDRNEPLTIAVVAISGTSLVFETSDLINYWFQSRYESKTTALATLSAHVISSVYKVVLLVSRKDVRWFAFAASLDLLIAGAYLFAAYKRHDGPRLSFSWAKGKKLLESSHHFILSGMMVAVYGQTDRLMLKHMLSQAEVGYYTAAQSVCNMWCFVLAAVIDSIYPTIIRLHGLGDRPGYERKNKQLYCIVFYASAFVSLLFLLLGDFAINLLYGAAYSPAALPLKILTWLTAFSYLGVARGAWIVCENQQRHLKSIYAAAAGANVLMNLALIPLWGAAGAALASLITQLCTGMLFPLLWKDMRPNVRLMWEAMTFKGVFGARKDD